jgi:quinoprotein glucose dehydrogenase
VAVAATGLTVPIGITAQRSAHSIGEWRYIAGDASSTKYSPLDQITRDNVKQLEVAWRWGARNFGPSGDSYYEATPIMIGGVLYTTAGSRRDAVAIDAATGETLWMYRLDEGSRGAKAPTVSRSGRGAAYWTDGVEERILHVTQGYHLAALNARTGEPIRTFGKSGVIDLYQGLDSLEPPPDGTIGWNSPPLVVGDIVVVGASFGVTSYLHPTVAHIRGYDVRTGRARWSFRTVPRPGEFGSETWENGSVQYAGNVGAWAPVSADLELGYVYVPVEAAIIDYSGQHRPGNNLFSESLVCLDARTGKRIWHYQLAHHGLWDYDPPTQPILMDVTVGGRKIKAVVQLTKQAFAFAFNRLTGEPIWPIEERPVPKGDVPGEWYSPTQPFPSKPPPFDLQGLTEQDLIDFTPELHAEAKKYVSEYRTGPIYMPPSIPDSNGTKGTIMVPGAGGGANWQGGAFDPETGFLYVASATIPTRVSLLECDHEKVPIPTLRYCAFGARLTDIQGLPIVRPPWGRITAINMNTGEPVWMVPNADAPEFVRSHPALKGVMLPRTGTPERSGMLVTKTLLFAGEGGGFIATPPFAGGPMFRAYDKATGQVLAEFKLPAKQTGVPMTYMNNQRQFIVIPVGAPGVPAELVALALPASAITPVSRPSANAN